MTIKLSNQTGRSLTPVVRVLLVDFAPVPIAALWRSACALLPAIEVRMYCRTYSDLDTKSTLADHYDVILVDSASQLQWLQGLENPPLSALLRATIVIAGDSPAQSLQSRLLRAGYADVVCVLDTHAKTIIGATIKAHLRQLRRDHRPLSPEMVEPIQRMLD